AAFVNAQKAARNFFVSPSFFGRLKAGKSSAAGALRAKKRFRRASPRKRFAEASLALADGVTLAEEQRDAPQAGNADDGVDHAADHRGLPAAEVGHQVELKQADQQPVDGAEDGDDERSTIQHDVSTPFPPA